MKGCVNQMEKKNNGWSVVLIVAALVAALTAILVLFVRTEQRMYRMLGLVSEYLPRHSKNTQFEVEL